ncbi:HtaA domain-containing protein [Georgenia sp. SYP-B2076]|uniref:HtaA domain-containing protein n=1 Tax=Georgenia sp. SYP-B2076 TaxID=2495881 RepID=UPI0013E04E35|nr:HtaA domain-containing protein [Georgenia sp. SYP-B2076]
MATTPGLTWAVKDSLLSYIEALDDGTVEALAPASRSGAGFLFPWDEGGSGDLGSGHHLGAPDGDLAFLGAVRLTGHWGMLDVELREPRVTLSDGTGALLVRERGSRDPGKWLPFADLAVEEPQVDAGGATFLAAAASLTGHGRLLLGGQYDAGTPLSRLHITFPPRHG